ncbi:MAG: hypothetical protein N3E46_05395 [Gemmataceae bacterium]|jgi:hypothetical protein|uniref:Uncharacterized protein n=1 Tax=Thermogemmata fonticola TaxID=2755323 RepID=A0A7V8VF47_9BACT|nr:hypothetical protein [Thermogemmata fonticola]MBA2226662.1 hypothetical protein [Thermogemmata fonticola]MCX8139096.1 hypothetical protein [Gemmataceae bacterium]
MSKLRGLVLLLALCWPLGTLGCGSGADTKSTKTPEPTKTTPPIPPGK